MLANWSVEVSLVKWRVEYTFIQSFLSPQILEFLIKDGNLYEFVRLDKNLILTQNFATESVQFVHKQELNSCIVQLNHVVIYLWLERGTVKIVDLGVGKLLEDADILAYSEAGALAWVTSVLWGWT